MRQEKQEDSAVRGLMTIGTLFSCLFCMLASGVLLNMPILGGVLCLTGQCAILFGSLRRPGRDVVSQSVRHACAALLIALGLILLTLIAVCPVSLSNPVFWQLGGIVLCMLRRLWLTRYALERVSGTRLKTVCI